MKGNLKNYFTLVGELDSSTSHFDFDMVEGALATTIVKDVTCRVCLLIALAKMSPIGFIVYSIVIIKEVILTLWENHK